MYKMYHKMLLLKIKLAKFLPGCARCAPSALVTPQLTYYLPTYKL